MTYEMDKRYFEMESRLQNLTKKSMVPKVEKRMDIAIAKQETPTELPTDEMNLRDIRLDDQLSKISRNSVIQYLKPTKVKSLVTEEMIKQYQRKLEAQKYEDPITGQVFKYNPGNLDVDLEVPNLESRSKHAANLVRKKQFSFQKKRLADNIQGAVDAIKGLEQQKIDLTERLNRALYDVNMAFNDADKERLIQENERSRMGFDNDMKNLDYEIEDARKYIALREKEIGLLDADITSQVELTGDMQKEIDRVSKLNRAKLQAKSEELNLLNRGRFNIERQPNETDEEFRKRLIETGQATYDDKLVQDQAQYDTLMKFIENMRRIIKDGAFIDSFTKYLTTQFGYDDLYIYNKYFKLLETKFNEVFGDISFDDTEAEREGLKDFFDATISKTKEGTLINIADEKAYAKAEPIIAAARMMKETELMRVRKAIQELGAKYDLTFSKGKLGSTIPQEMTVLELIKKYGKEYEDAWAYSSTEERTALYGLSVLKPPYQKQLVLGLLMESGLIPEKLKVETPRGSGIRPKYEPNRVHKSMVDFGDLKIDQKLLHGKNRLSVFTKNGSSMTGFPMTQVSDSFCNVIFKILEDKPVSHLDLKQLDKKEKDLYNLLIDIAGFRRDILNDIEETRENMKNRLKLLEGEIDAGNNNPDIYKELHALLMKMFHGGMISVTQAMKHYQSLGGKLKAYKKKSKC